MPTNKDYLYIPTDEQQLMIDSVAQKLRVEPSTIEVDTNGYMHVDLPKGVDAAKIVAEINSYDEKFHLTNNEVPKEMVALDSAGRLQIDMEQMRDYASIHKTVPQKMPDGNFKPVDIVSYKGGSDFEQALLEGGQVIYDAEQAQNPQIPPSRVAANLEATLGGTPVKPGFGGQYTIEINATPEARQRISDIIEETRKGAALDEVAVINDAANGQIILTGVAADIEKLNAKILEGGKGAGIETIIAGSPMQYDRAITRGGAAEPSSPAPGGSSVTSAEPQQTLADLKEKIAEAQTKIDVLAVKALDEHGANGYLVTENTKTKKTNVAVEAIAERLGVEITKDGDLTKQEIQALQEKVGAKTNSRGEFDGIIGPDTLAQIKKAMAGKMTGTATDVEAPSAPTTASAVAKSTGVGMDMA